MEGGTEGGRERGREREREEGREGGREGEREGGRERGRGITCQCLYTCIIINHVLTATSVNCSSNLATVHV